MNHGITTAQRYYH